MIERYEIVGAESISALEQPIYMESQWVDMESTPTKYNMDLKRADMESAPTQNNVESVGADSISALNRNIKYTHVFKRADVSQRANVSQRAEIDSAPTYKYNRKSLRLPHYDYAKAGYYFITITAQNRAHLFGEIVDGMMVPNLAGEMVCALWHDISNDFKYVQLHDFVIMPNHIHGIIEIVKHDNPVGADSISALPMDLKRVDMGSKRAEIDSAPTLSMIVQSFKRHTTLRYIKMVKNGTLPPFDKRIWQRNFYEHVIRDDDDYARIAEYIENNPSSWEMDTLNTP